jgi:uncharacterized membrane protein YdjX (TVP38/TMEM64 family)
MSTAAEDGVAVTSWPRRHAYPLLVTGMLCLFLALFVVVEQLHVPVLTDADASFLDRRSWVVALTGVGLLVADVVLPVPSSGVMIAQGAVFGLVVGAALSLVGGTAATAAAYLVGRRGRGLVERLVSPEQQRRAEAYLDRHGVWAIVVTRPVPMLAETVGILAGTSRITLRSAVLAGAVGNVVPAVAYAAVGAYTATLVSGLLVFVGVLLVGGVVWVVQRRR